MVKCAVIGCGLMGCKIAGELAYHGHRVKMHDTDIIVLNSVYKRLSDDRRELLQDGILLQLAFPGQIFCMSHIEETVQDADFIFEAVIDDLSVKKDLFEKISRYAPPTAILATNTLSLDIDAVMEKVDHKERLLGLRFLFPVYYIPEVEITPASATAPSTISKVRELIEKMGKTLFFRSGAEPLILTEDQREDRKRIRQQQILNMSGFSRPLSVLPDLSGSAGTLSSFSAGPGLGFLGNSDGGGSGGYHASECAICLDLPRDCVLEPCRHLVLCRQCANLLHSRHDYCPVCRRQIQDVANVYLP